MKLAPFVLSAVVSVVALSAVACAGSVESPQSTSSAASKAPIAASSHGAVKMMSDALGEVSLRPDQRVEIEKLATEAEARHQPLFAGRKELMLAFADQVESGAVDAAALGPKIDKVAADMTQARTADRAAIVKLHDLLDKQQRGELVDALEKSFKAKHGFGEGEHGGRAGLRELAEDLKLTDDQKDKIKEVLKEAWREGRKSEHEARNARHDKHDKHGGWGKHHASAKQALAAFREDKLDLEALARVAPPQDIGSLATNGVDRIAKTAGKLLPILTPEQKKLAADKLRERANGGDTSLLIH